MAIPTISSVALKAGVSVASVSRVINGIPVKPLTVKRVQEAIAELSYEPNSAARSLKIGQSDQIYLSFADIGNPAYLAMTRGIDQVLRQSKYRLVLSSSVSSEEEIVAQLKSLARGYADGLIFSPIYSSPEITQLIKSLPIPVVLVGTRPQGLLVDNIYVDSGQGIAFAVEHLATTGRKKIALINGPLSTSPGIRRQQGFEKAMAKYDLPISEQSFLQAEDFTSSAGYEVAASISSFSQYDAFVCVNDLVASGVMRNLAEKKISIPDDIAIVGIDNTELATVLNPTLTSVDLHAEQRGVLAAQMLLRRIENQKKIVEQEVIQPEIVLRASSVAGGRK